MGGAERVEFAFCAACEARQATALAQGAHAVAAARDDLVRIGLMPHIPHQPVMRRVEHGVDCHSELHDAQRCAEVAAGAGNDIDRLGPQLRRQLLELVDRQIAQIGRYPDPVEQRGPRLFCHSPILGARLARHRCLRPVARQVAAIRHRVAVSCHGRASRGKRPRLALCAALSDNPLYRHAFGRADFH